MAVGELEAQKLPPGIFLLFDKGRRPRKSDIVAALASSTTSSISHDPSLRDERHPQAEQEPVHSHTGEWLELLQWGMTFDLLGLAPGPAVTVPEIAYRFGCDVETGTGSEEALALVPGPHLADGSHSLPIVRAQLDVAAALSGALGGVLALCWSPARSAMGPKLFRRSVETWLSGGPFPALGLTGFSVGLDGSLRSEGLDHFIGQELALDSSLSDDRVGATQLAVRLVHEMVGSGKLEASRRFVTSEGKALRLAPDQEGKIIQVTPM